MPHASHPLSLPCPRPPAPACAHAPSARTPRGTCRSAHSDTHVSCVSELLWKSYIDFEISEEDHDRVRALYRRLLDRTKHVKVWISFSQFEAAAGEVERARALFTEARLPPHAIIARAVYTQGQPWRAALRRCPPCLAVLYNPSPISRARAAVPVPLIQANGHYKNSIGEQTTGGTRQNTNEERVMLLESWNDFEDQFGDVEQKKTAKGLLPKRVKRKRPIDGVDGDASGWEEFYAYIFPDEQGAQARACPRACPRACLLHEAQTHTRPTPHTRVCVRTHMCACACASAHAQCRAAKPARTAGAAGAATLPPPAGTRCCVVSYAHSVPTAAGQPQDSGDGSQVEAQASGIQRCHDDGGLTVCYTYSLFHPPGSTSFLVSCS